MHDRGENLGLQGGMSFISPPKSTHLLLGRHLTPRKNLSKSVHDFLSNLADRQTDRQTDTGKNVTFGGGNNTPIYSGEVCSL